MPSLFPLHSPLHIYIHCATSVDYLSELNATIPAIEHCAERALLLADRDDIVCVPDEVDPAYLEYLAELGVGPAAANLLVASRFSAGRNTDPLWQRIASSEEALEHLSCLVKRNGSARLHPFIVSPGQFALAAALQQRSGRAVEVYGGDPAVVAYADQKHHVRSKAIELGIPVAPGEVVDLGSITSRAHDHALLRAAIERQMSVTGRVIVRGTSGAAGSSTFAVERVEQIEPLVRNLSDRRENRIYLVEAMVDMTVSPNVQMHVARDIRGIRCAGMTDQRWKRPLVHGGNCFPSSARRAREMLSWSRTMSEWLHSVGFIGLAGFDFVEYTDRAGEPQAFLAELNPRINGATYPVRLRRRLNVAQREAGFPEVRAFTSGTIETEARTFTELRDVWEDRLFCPETGTGLVPSAPGMLRVGKCGVVALATTPQEADELYQDASAAMATV